MRLVSRRPLYCHAACWVEEVMVIEVQTNQRNGDGKERRLVNNANDRAYPAALLVSKNGARVLYGRYKKDQGARGVIPPRTNAYRRRFATTRSNSNTRYKLTMDIRFAFSSKQRPFLLIFMMVSRTFKQLLCLSSQLELPSFCQSYSISSELRPFCKIERDI